MSWLDEHIISSIDWKCNNSTILGIVTRFEFFFLTTIGVVTPTLMHTATHTTLKKGGGVWTLVLWVVGTLTT